MQSNNFNQNQQDILITTIHDQESVLEVYLNEAKITITELKHSANHRVSVYRHSVEDYLMQRDLKNVDKKLLAAL